MSALLALLVLCVAAPPGAADPAAATPAVQQAGRECKKCHGAGRIPCPEHEKNECELEDHVLFCSVVADCPVCKGAGFLACDICNDEAVKKSLEERHARIEERREALKSIDATMGRPLRKAETDHYVIVWEMDKIKVDKRWIGPHEALHLYTKRMEEFYADYGARLATKPDEFSRKTWMFVWYLPADHETGAMKFCSQGAKGGVKLMGAEARYSVCGNKQNFQNDEALWRNLVHCGTHILLANQTPPQWIGNIKGGWADEGLAHWFEDRYWGICDTYCYQEQNTNVDFKSGKYRLAMRKMIVEGHVPPIADVFQQNVDTLTLPMNVACFSYVDYLLFRDGAKFKELVKLLKVKKPTREALQEVYGVSPIEFETQWKAWVLETYPTR
jgi:hypothetical protein